MKKRHRFGPGFRKDFRANPGKESLKSVKSLGESFAKSLGMEVKAHHDAGRPIHYYDERFPEGIVRKWPNGRRELVSMDLMGSVSVIRQL